jgi:hypothetical protein
MLYACQRGAQWLYHMNGVKGRFLAGYVPPLQREMEGDHFLRQAGAAFALARAARTLGEEHHAARATQAILALLEETTSSASDARARYTALPPALVNRVGGNAALIQAINELPAPQADLLEKSEQLCQYIRSQAQRDGSLALAEGETATEEEVNEHAGAALYALMLSHRHRPAAWKVDLVRKALPHYRAWWREHKSLAFVPCQTAAFTEAYLLTRDQGFADFVNEMTDWACSLQYAPLEPHRMLWYGGFRGWAAGRPVESAPTVECAAIAEGLAQACRVAREAGDATRHGRDSEALERCLQFLTRLQYTDASTQHFADWYRPRLVGGFHASHDDGNLRIDHTQHAVSALALYLEHVAR